MKKVYPPGREKDSRMGLESEERRIHHEGKRRYPYRKKDLLYKELDFPERIEQSIGEK